MSSLVETPKGEKVMTDSECRLLFIKLDEIQNELKELKIPTGWLDLAGAVSYSSLSRSSLLRAVRSDRLKCSKENGKLMFRIRWIDQFLLFGHCNRLTPKQRTDLEL